MAAVGESEEPGEESVALTGENAGEQEAVQEDEGRAEAEGCVDMRTAGKAAGGVG